MEKYDKEYEEKFNNIRELLGKGKTGEAFISLKDLYRIDSSNHYINYLMGVCFTEQNIVTEQSIKHLEYAKDSILEEYKYIPYDETRAPIFAWYYLTKAYSQNGYCSKARWAKENFKKYDTDFTDNSYFIKNIDKFIIDCDQYEAELRAKRRKESVVTKRLDYSISQPLYGVQVGAFKELVPIREEFDNLKNVEAFMDNEGTLRYVMGHFSIKSQAQSLLEIVKERGYKDAFIVNVNEENRFSNEVIIVDNMSFKTHISGKIRFKVQLGAFKDSIPEELAKLYLEVDGIEETYQNELTLIQVGSYEAYEDAIEKKDRLITLGIPGPFVVAYDSRQRLSIRAALKYIEQQKLEETQKIEEDTKRKRRKNNGGL